MKTTDRVPENSAKRYMKPTIHMLSIHKTFEVGEDSKRQPTFYVYDGNKVEKMTDIVKFVEEFKPGTTVRLTSVYSLDVFLRSIEARGGKVVYAHWHNTGIDKGASPEIIAQKYYELPENLFRPFIYDDDLAQLKSVLDQRNALNQFYDDAVRKIKQAGRNRGVMDVKEDEDSSDAIGVLDSIFDQFKSPVGEKLVSFDTRIKQLASKNELCILFNKIAGISDSSWVTAATVACITQGVERFPNVASLWSYFGQSVVDGAAPRRKKGSPSNWSAAGRKTMYLLGETIIKNKKNPWREYFDDAKALAVAQHEEKCGCKAKLGHPHAQARRKMVKEILKRFYLAASGIEFDSDHIAVEAPCQNVAVRAAKAA